MDLRRRLARSRFGAPLLAGAFILALAGAPVFARAAASAGLLPTADQVTAPVDPGPDQADGPNGQSGKDEADGPNGQSGKDEADGPNGQSGTDEATGANGQSGTDEAAGANGQSGTNEAHGSNGQSGGNDGGSNGQGQNGG